MSNLERARHLLAAAVNGAAVDIGDEARIGQTEGWDSLAHLRLLLAIEEEIGRTLDPEEAVGIDSLADVAALLDRAA